MSERVGVVVLNYRGSDDTIACVRSLASSTEPLRVVVVDNGSDDGSVAAIRAALPAVELIANDTNLGFGAGNNVALERLLADGHDWSLVLNNDTTVEPETVRAMVAAGEADDRIGVVGAAVYDASRPARLRTWGGGSVSRRTGRTREARGPDDRVDYVTGAAALYRSAALREVGVFDPAFFFLYEDADLGVRLTDAGWTTVVAGDARVHHAFGASAAEQSPWRVEQHATGLVQFLRCHSRWPRLGSVPMLVHYAGLAVRRRSAALWRAAWRGWWRGWAVAKGGGS